MTADGELYVDEQCRDAFAQKLDKWFGVNNWDLSGSEFWDLWDMRLMPNSIIVNVLDSRNRENILGKVKITNRFFVDDNGYGKYIECAPENIELVGK